MYNLLANLVEPYVGLMLLLGVALVVSFCKGNLTGSLRWWVATPYVALFLLSTTPVACSIVSTLEWPVVPNEWSAEAEAIVVLSGAFSPPRAGSRAEPLATAKERAQEPSPSTLIRCLHAAEVYRLAPRVVVCSGGPSTALAEESDAVQMKRLLEMFRIPEEQILLEEQSRSTFENAQETAKVLRARGISRVILVTDALHMQRSILCFEKQGIAVEAAPCNFRSADPRHFSPSWLLPTQTSLAGTHAAVHEWLGMIWYWWKGRI